MDIKGLHDAVGTFTRTILPLPGFLFVLRGMEKNNKTRSYLGFTS